MELQAILFLTNTAGLQILTCLLGTGNFLTLDSFWSKGSLPLIQPIGLDRACDASGSSSPFGFYSGAFYPI